MGKIITSINNVKELLKDLVTSENTDQIAKISKSLDEVENVANTMETENTSLKDKIVDMVKGTISTKEPKDPNDIDDTPKSLDDIMEEEAQKISDKRHKED